MFHLQANSCPVYVLLRNNRLPLYCPGHRSGTLCSGCYAVTLRHSVLVALTHSVDGMHAHHETHSALQFEYPSIHYPYFILHLTETVGTVGLQAEGRGQ